MESISHRVLRNESGRILKAVAAGESFTITNNGEPVARIVPIDAPRLGLPLSRPARIKGGWSDLPLYESDIPSEQLIAEMREDRL
jgi:prevent-host-death family protein